MAAAFLSQLAVNASAITDNYLEVYFLNVGQGDAIFIQTPSGNQVLIDGGPDNAVIGELSKIMPFNDRSIDLVILTHPDADHLNGLIEVLERYEVKHILEYPIPHKSVAYDQWNQLKPEAQIMTAWAGQTIDLGLGATIQILYPFKEGEPKTKSNNNSIVAKLMYGEHTLLLTGDIEALVEKELVYKKVGLDADFLKLPHHGSKTSSAQNFLDAISPMVTFIMVGLDNKYGHPHSSVIERLEKSGIKYYRTDTDDTIKLILDNNNFVIKTSH